MGPTSASFLVLCIEAAMSFSPDALIGIRSAPKERFERQLQPLIGIRSKDEIGASTEGLVGFKSPHQRLPKQLQSYEEISIVNPTEIAMKHRYHVTVAFPYGISGCYYFNTLSTFHIRNPLSRRKSAQAHDFCADNLAFFNSNCLGMFTDRDENVRQALFRFCPWFENKCLHLQ